MALGELLPQPNRNKSPVSARNRAIALRIDMVSPEKPAQFCPHRRQGGMGDFNDFKPEPCPEVAGRLEKSCLKWQPCTQLRIRRLCSPDCED